MTASSTGLGSLAIPKLFSSMSLPIIFGLLVGGLYNVVDALFVTRGLGINAIGGVSIVFPIQMMIIALAGWIGSGAASIVARRLGAKNMPEAERAAGNTLFLALVMGCSITALCLFFMHDLLDLLAVTPALKPYSLEYLVPILSATPAVLLGAAFSDLARAEGKMKILMLSMLLGSITNIILDPIAIFVLGWGVQGVAYATVFSQLLSLALLLFVFGTGRTDVKIKLSNIRFNAPISGATLALGFPLFINYFGVSLVIGLVNYSLSQSGLTEADYLISAYGILGRVFVFVFFPLLGMTIAYQTICGYNYGAQAYDRVAEVTRFAVKVTSIYCGSITLFAVLFPDWIFRIFTTDVQLIAQGQDIARFLFLGFALAGATNIWSIYFQAIGQAKPALILSSLHVYVLQIPMLIILPLLFGINAIWYIFPISDALTFLVSLLVIRWAFRKLAHQRTGLAPS
jgi:putative MATE family efflux protein